MDDLLTLEDVARRLGVSRRRVQAMVSSSALPAERVGVQWLVPVSAVNHLVHTRAGSPGRPWNPATAWRVISQLEQTPPLRGDLDRLRRRLRARAAHSAFYLHPGVMRRARDDRRLVLGGRDAASVHGVPVDPTDLDLYVRQSDVDAVLRPLHARRVSSGANAFVHVVDDGVWPFARGERFVRPWVAWLDLEDRQDRAADTLVDRLVGGRVRA